MTSAPEQPLAAALVRRLLRRDLRRAFRRVCWTGPWPDLPADAPVVVYANHHNYYDGHLLWLLVEQALGRPCLLWMQDWARFPLFAPLGSLPFPADDAARRGATVRHTARAMRAAPRTALLYFPEGKLHPPEGGLLPFPADETRRLGCLLPAPLWLPVAIHVTWWGEAHPTAVLASPGPHPAREGALADALSACWHDLRTATPPTHHVLLDGHRGSSEAWDLSWTSPFFRRYL